MSSSPSSVERATRGHSMEPLFTVHFKGHPNVRATNRMTLEVTREDFLTLGGDCIIGIKADSGCLGLDARAKSYMMREGSKLRFALMVNGSVFEFSASGSSALTLTHPTSMVVRRSTYTCPRTLAVRSSAAAWDVPRPMVTRLASGADGELSAFQALD